jgi:hypothetical protein
LSFWRRVAVALAGSKIEKDGQEIEVKKASIGGVMSTGMLCDSTMLGWAGGAAGIAAQIPESIEIGSAPPLIKPRHGELKTSIEAAPAADVEPLFEKKLTKEEKKALAAEKRAAKKAAKETVQTI